MNNRFMVVHPIPPPGFPLLEEHYFEIYEGKALPIGGRFINPTLAPHWKSTIFEEVNRDMVIFSDFYFPTNSFGDIKIIVTKATIGSFTIPTNLLDSPWADMIGGFFESGGVASICTEGCGSCVDGTSCDKCYAGNIKVGDFCEPCGGDCKTCDPASSSSGYDSCISCFEYAYLSGTSCVPCDETCLRCGGSATNCTACYPG